MDIPLTKKEGSRRHVLLFLAAVSVSACGENSSIDPADLSVLISPSSVTVAPGTEVLFTANVVNSDDLRVSWRVMEGAAGGMVSLNGIYLAPEHPGIYHVVATSLVDTAQKSEARVEVRQYAATAGAANGLPPDAPLLTLLTPGSPSNESAPTVWGTAEAGTVVRVYNNSNCVGDSLGLGQASAITGDFAVEIVVEENATTTLYAQATDIENLISPCSSTSLTYVEDSIAPIAPSIKGASGVVYPATTLLANLISQVVEVGGSIEPVVPFRNGVGSAVAYQCKRDTTADGVLNWSAASLCNLQGMNFDVATGTLTWSAVKERGEHELMIRATWDGNQWFERLVHVFVGSVPAFNRNQPVISGLAEAQSVVRLFGNGSCSGSILGQDTANALGSFNIVANVPDSSTTTFYAKAIDAAGNESSCSLTTIAYVEDSLGQMPTVDFVEPASPANNNNPSVWGTAEPLAQMSLHSNAMCTGDPLAVGNATSGGVFKIQVSVPDNSSTVFFARAVDSLGNVSSCSQSFVVYVEDSMAPPGPSMAEATPVPPANNNAPFISGVAEPLANVQIYGNSNCSGSALASGAVTSWGAFSIPVVVADDSQNTFYGKTVDAAGNASACSATFVTYVEDSTPPDRPLPQSVNPVSPSNDNFPVVSGTAEANSVIKFYTNPQCLGGVVGTGATNSSGAFSVPVTLADNSIHVLYARAFDAAGNGSECSTGSVVYVEDSLPPAAPGMATSNPQSPSFDNTPFILGIGEPLTTVKLYGDAGCSGSVLGAGPVEDDGTFQVEISVSDDSISKIYGQLTDAAGNVSTCSVTFVIYVEDSTPPAPPNVLYVDPTPPADNNNPTISGEAEPGATIHLFSNSNCSGQSLGSGISNEVGVFAVIATVPDGFDAWIFANATDSAGNVSNCSTTSVRYIEDSTPPVVTFTSPRNGSMLNPLTLGAVSFSGTCSEVGRFVDLVAPCANAVVLCLPGGVWTAANVDLSALCPGAVEFEASQTDAAKNRGEAELVLAYFPTWNADPYSANDMAKFQSATDGVFSSQLQQLGTIGTNLTGTSKWFGGVVGPQLNTVYSIPHSATAVLKVDVESISAPVISTLGALPVGAAKWEGGVLAPNKAIYGIPRNASSVLKIAIGGHTLNTVADSVTTFGSLVGVDKWSGGVVAPSGVIYGIPFSATQVLKITPANDSTSTFGTLAGDGKWVGGVLAPNGKIYGIPWNSTTILKIDPETDATSTFGNEVGSSKWAGGVLGWNGMIYAIPFDATSVLKIDPSKETVSTLGTLPGASKWRGGVLGSDGKIYGMPSSSTSILCIDPKTDTVSLIPLESISGTWAGASVTKNGQILAIPSSATSVLSILAPLTSGLLEEDFLLSRHLNKF